MAAREATVYADHQISSTVIFHPKASINQRLMPHADRFIDESEARRLRKIGEAVAVNNGKAIHLKKRKSHYRRAEISHLEEITAAVNREVI